MRRMECTIEDLFPPERAGAQYTDGRTPGVHVSDVVRDLASRLEPGRFPAQIRREGTPPPPRRTNPKWEMGLAFEDQLGDRLADRYSRLYAPQAFRPGEITVDDIIGTPDLIDPDTRVWNEQTQHFDIGEAVEEWKASTLSSRHDINGGKFTYFVWQLKSYCHMQQVNTGRLRILFVVGDWLFEKSPEPGAHFYSFEETWTNRELQEHWDMIRKHRDKMLRERGER